MVVGVMAIIMSMAESRLNSTSVIMVNDFIKILYPNINASKQLTALRALVVILSVVSVSIVFTDKSSVELLLTAYNFWDPIILVPISAGFLGFRTNSNSFIASTITALAFTFLGRFIAGEFATISLSFGVIGSAIGLFGMHYLQILKGNIEGEANNLIMSLRYWIQDKVLAVKTGIINFIKAPIKLLTQKVDLHKIKIRQFCTFTLTYYVIYSLIITPYFGHQVFSNLLIIGYCLCMLLLFRDFIVSKKFQRKYMHVYWYFILTFCLPFVSSYMLFVSKSDDFWVINSMLCAFSLFFFIDAMRFILLYSIGVACGYALFKVTEYGL